MIFYLFRFCFFILLAFTTLASGQSYIGYVKIKGRFGDQLTHYVRAKWVSYKTGLPLVFSPFEGSDLLMLSQYEKLQREHMKFSKVKLITSLDQIPLSDQGHILYDMEYVSSFHYEYEKVSQSVPDLQIDWSDKEFLKIIRELIQPLQPLELVYPPEGRLSIALHYRTGVGYDPSTVDRIFPLKFPPKEFYAEQIHYVYELLGRPPLYIYLFTDDPEPVKQVEKLKRLINIDSIQWGCSTKTTYTSHILEDFFSLMNFDCLIHPASYFSWLPSYLGDFRVAIMPRTFHYRFRQTVVDSCEIRIAEPEMVGG